MSKKYHVILLLALPVILIGCSKSETELRLHMPAYSAIEAKALQPVFEQQSGLRIIDDAIESNQSALQALVNGDADLALVENSSPFQTGVRAVLPVYRSVLHILIREGMELDDSEQPLRDRTVYISHESPAGRSFIEMATARQGLAREDVTIVQKFEPGQTDLVIYFGPINPRSPRWYVSGYRLYSLDYDNVERAMSSKAIAYMLPHVSPAIIPAQTYDLPGNEKDIYTLSVDTLLATRKDVSVDTIYQLTRTLLEQKPRFAAVAPEIFSGVTEDFDRYSLSFPLHRGAIHYLERDEPSFLERYAETINMLVYLFFLLLTGAFALAKLHAQRKKDRVDKFYAKVIAIRVRAMNEPHAPLLQELQQLELEAFESLISEKLAADDSFRIFIELLTRAISELDVEPAPVDDSQAQT